LYRDYTKAEFGKIHIVYYISLASLFIIGLFFSFFIANQISELVTPLKYLVGFIALMVVGPLSIVFYNMSKGSYYKE